MTPPIRVPAPGQPQPLPPQPKPNDKKDDKRSWSEVPLIRQANGVARMVTHSDKGAESVQKIVKVFKALAIAVEVYVSEKALRITATLDILDEYVDGVQSFGDIREIAEGALKQLWNEGICKFVGMVSLMASNVCSMMMLVGDRLKLVSWGVVQAKIGNTSIFGVRAFVCVKDLALERVARQTAVVGFFLLGIVSVNNWIQGKEILDAKLQLAHAAPEILFQLAMLASMTGGLVIALRLTAAIMDAVKMYHKVNK